MQIRRELRIVQRQSGCSTRTLNLVLQRLQPFLKGCEGEPSIKMNEVRTRKESPVKRRLSGCVGCNKFVFGPEDKSTECPKCAHPRYDEKGKLNEVCWFFPLKNQLSRLLKIAKYRQYLMYEREHITNTRRTSDYMCDIYDSPRWHKVVGAMGNRLTRIVLQMCVDGVPAFAKQNCKHVGSVKPIQYFVANLAPWLRYKARYMLVHALIPDNTF